MRKGQKEIIPEKMKTRKKLDREMTTEGKILRLILGAQLTRHEEEIQLRITHQLSRKEDNRVREKQFNSLLTRTRISIMTVTRLW